MLYRIGENCVPLEHGQVQAEIEGNSIHAATEDATHSEDLLHGVTLEMILKELVRQFGWERLGREIPIRCFANNPTLNSSLKFLRRTPWAREKVEALYIWSNISR